MTARWDVLVTASWSCSRRLSDFVCWKCSAPPSALQRSFILKDFGENDYRLPIIIPVSPCSDTWSSSSNKVAGPDFAVLFHIKTRSKPAPHWLGLLADVLRLLRMLRAHHFIDTHSSTVIIQFLSDQLRVNKPPLLEKSESTAPPSAKP